jgi:CHAT domain
MKYFTLILVILFSSCTHSGVIDKIGYARMSNVIDSIKQETWLVYQADTSSTKYGYYDWLNDNGGYILAINYIDDSLKKHPTNILAKRGYDIALQHGYQEQSLTFLSYYHQSTADDTVNVLLMKMTVYLSGSYTDLEDETLKGLYKYKCIIDTNRNYTFQYLSDLGMHYHNCHNYDSAIMINKQAYAYSKSNCTPNEIARACQRLANDYNDLYRNRLVNNEEKEIVFNNSKKKYLEAISELNRIKPLPEERLACSYFTLGLLVMNQDTIRRLDYFEKALSLLNPQVSGRNVVDYLYCKHPMYTSVILNVLSEESYDKYLASKSPEHSRNCIYYSELWAKLMGQTILEPSDDGVTFDMEKSFSERTLNRMVNSYMHIYPDSPGLAYKLLDISNKDKFAVLNKKHYLHSADDTDESKRLACISQIISAKSVAYNRNSKQLSVFTNKLDGTLKLLINQTHVIPPAITKLYIQDLQRWLGDQNATVVNLHYSKGFLFTSTINKDTVFDHYQNVEGTPVEPDLQNKLIALQDSNNVQGYADLANQVYRIIFDGSIDLKKYKRLIVVADKNLPISIDALVTDKAGAKTWSDLKYLGDNVIVYTIPNLQWLRYSDNPTNFFKLNYIKPVLKTNQPLPYSDQLGIYLKQKYSANTGHGNKLKDPSKFNDGILHIASHTEEDSRGYYSLLLDNTTIDPLKDATTRSKMVVLNACETQNGKALNLEGQISLSRLFLAYGADAVISSNMKSDNNASAELFKYFYEYLYSGKSVSESLFLAKKDLRKRTPEWNNPSYWAPYQLFGQDLTFTH